MGRTEARPLGFIEARLIMQKSYPSVHVDFVALGEFVGELMGLYAGIFVGFEHTHCLVYHHGLRTAE
jgi:hypothetical protein